MTDDQIKVYKDWLSTGDTAQNIANRHNVSYTFVRRSITKGLIQKQINGSWG